ncbi:MAG TPA: hypothetical protein VMS86_01285, partial [Thermoanaerobaculia bacterium]|nr:hypothetical protein [Thermoanaerobaculia bacterium]
PIQEIELRIPWEIDRQTRQSLVGPGPVGEYVEVVDHDPASKAFYAPVDLNDGLVLAQSGLAPAEGNPQFHQQMVYAVAMYTIANFEEALGRAALWAPRLVREEDGGVRQEFVRRLRIYPHALREANAYYSPAKKALLFGYFPARPARPPRLVEGRASPERREPAGGGMVFTCLSQDIVAHETTHALLDGLHPRMSERTNLDVLALHEAFADIVGMFQRFSHPEVLEHQIARTQGDLARQNLLGQLAQQFGRAIGRGGALRDALGTTDAGGEWRPHQPDPTELERTTHPHRRGAILVAAVFDAFLLIYKSRIADLLRIATHGTGVLPQGDIHPDLVRRMAREAADTAHRVLQMCIRALDYCPPVDVTFGDYLRAIVTADADLYPEDERRYRVAFVQAFRRRGIFPRGVRSLSEETLVWPTGADAMADAIADATAGAAAAVEAAAGAAEGATDDASRRAAGAGSADAAGADPGADSPVQQWHRRKIREDLSSLIHQRAPGKDERARAPEPDYDLSVDWDLEVDREYAWRRMQSNGQEFHRWLTAGPGRSWAPALGLTLDPGAPPSVARGRGGVTPAVEIHSVRTALRRGARGAIVTELVVAITQRRFGWLDRERQRSIDGDALPGAVERASAAARSDFRFRRGATILIDPSTMEVRRVIRTRGTVADDGLLEELRAFLAGEDPDPPHAFAGLRHDSADAGDETFARLHRLTP